VPEQRGTQDVPEERAGDLTEDLREWCRQWLGSYPNDVLFARRHLSDVTGLTLVDGRQVVIKVRADEPALAGRTAVHRHLYYAGFPVPELLAGPAPLGDRMASAEAYVAGDELLDPNSAHAVEAYAGLLARLITTAPRAADLPPLAPAPPWTAWNHEHPGTWPPADDLDIDLNGSDEAAWLDELARSVQRRLARHQAPAVIGHGDWEAQNLRWSGLDPVVVHDWDSVIAAPEAIVVGLAAAVWAGGFDPAIWHSTVPQTNAFLETYQHAVGRWWSPDDLEVAWAAGLWVRAFNAKKYIHLGHVTLAPAESADRAARAGLDWQAR
jgi:hypothetical protein